MNTQITDANNSGLVPGADISGYKIIRTRYLEESSAFFYELEHIGTGAKHVHISNSDSENTFSVAFKTVPADSTGVAHILEHTVLCGSDRFPVRDPFFSMIKRSLNTFMNAFTSSDWTMYPFSTQNKKDYINLMDVYLDATFFPRLDELSFKQEGHRLEFEKQGGAGDEALVYKGVVYNEMKGAMSSPSQVMGRSILNALYPTTTYGWNSGGEPKIIPRLTLDHLRTFHKQHYHPSNAYFYTYGNFSLRETLLHIEEKVLRQFGRIDPGTHVPNELRWEKARKVKYYYPLDKNEDCSKKCQVAVGWLTADINESFEMLVLALLSHILLGNSGSPLRKALIDSGLGSSLCDTTGFDPDNRDTMFVCGLKDVDENDAAQIESIIFNTLTDLADKGIDPELIETAIHQIEFRQKEVTNSPYPYGIKCLLRMTGSWFHGGDPVKSLQLDSDFKKLEQKLSAGNFLENRIRHYFLENNHRVLFTLAPDQQLEEKERLETAKELSAIQKKLTPRDNKKIRSDSEALKYLQEADEDLSCLPTLKINDISGDVKIITENKGYENIPAACYQQPTSGIFYFASASGIKSLPEHLLPLLPFFCLAFTKLGTKKRDYSELARRISAVTGGLGMSANARTGFDETGKCRPFISFSGKCLNRKQSEMFELFHECVSEYDFSNTERIKSLLLEYKAGLESSVVQNGHALAITSTMQNFSDTCRLSELWNGICQIRFIKGLSDSLNRDNGGKLIEKIKEDFYSIAEFLFAEKKFRHALIGEDKMIQSAGTGIESVADVLGNDLTAEFPVFEIIKPGAEISVRQGWFTNTAVSFVGASFQTVPMGHDDAPGLAVISKILRSNYLHRVIREKGGAYGGFAIYNSEDGTFSFGSYRDPHICKTLEIFENAGSYLKSGDFSEEDVAESILQIASAIDKPDTPGTAARKAFYRKMLFLSDEKRLNYKQRILAVTRDDVVRLAEKYFTQNNDELSVSVISGEDKLIHANKKLGGKSLSLSGI